MPPDDGLGLDEGKRLSPVGPDSGQYDPQRSIPIGQGQSVGIPLQNIELMTQREVLEDQRPSRPERREQRT